MTNLIETIYTKIISKLNTAGITTVYRYPEDLPLFGNNYPFAYIEEGDKEYIATSGQIYEYTVPIHITLCSDVIQNRTYYMNNLEVAVMNQLFANLDLDGTVINVNPISTQVGTRATGSDLDLKAGYTETNSFRTITIECLVHDTRI